MYKLSDVGEVLLTTGRLLAFRPAVPDLKRLGPLYVAMGLAFAWLAGIGRYWDNPRAELWQTLGLGSVAYVFVMALLLWIIVWPLNPRGWRYRSVLVFVALTSPPAILYAIPVERFLSLDAAQSVNIWFLVTVALWRVILLWVFLQRAAGLTLGVSFVGTLLPIALIVVALSLFNLEHATFEIMGGLDPAQRTPNDAAYAVLITITLFSSIALPFLLLAYMILCLKARPSRWDKRSDERHGS
ncbi:hypothetical protein [Pelagibius sp.]|uniref:hypothetical protein n=1 Tax=Pelagibius sp. TaxID=1931238 RepID=UPI00262F9351|nr:hypothetical protein [Pelagibius sp.]